MLSHTKRPAGGSAANGIAVVVGLEHCVRGCVCSFIKHAGMCIHASWGGAGPRSVLIWGRGGAQAPRREVLFRAAAAPRAVQSAFQGRCGASGGAAAAAGKSVASVQAQDSAAPRRCGPGMALQKLSRAAGPIGSRGGERWARGRRPLGPARRACECEPRQCVARSRLARCAPLFAAVCRHHSCCCVCLGGAAGPPCRLLRHPSRSEAGAGRAMSQYECNASGTNMVAGPPAI